MQSASKSIAIDVAEVSGIVKFFCISELETWTMYANHVLSVSQLRMAKSAVSICSNIPCSVFTPASKLVCCADVSGLMIIS